MRQASLLFRSSIVPECTQRTSLALLTHLEESTWLPGIVDRIEEILRNRESLLRCCIAAVLLLLLPSPIWHRGPSHYPASGADKACATVQVPRARKLEPQQAADKTQNLLR